MKADFLDRANTTKSVCEADDRYSFRHIVFGDGVCRDAVVQGRLGSRVFLAPGRSDREYDTVALDSPAR